MNAIKSSRTHRQRQVSFDVQSIGDLPSPPTMDGDLPEAQVAVSCKFKHFVLQNHTKPVPYELQQGMSWANRLRRPV